jgi:hypothetical protein
MGAGALKGLLRTARCYGSSIAVVWLTLFCHRFYVPPSQRTATHPRFGSPPTLTVPPGSTTPWGSPKGWEGPKEREWCEKAERPVSYGSEIVVNDKPLYELHNPPTQVQPGDQWNGLHHEAVFCSPGDERWSFVSTGYVYPEVIPDMEENDKSEMDVDFLVPMVVGDEFESPSTAFHPPSACHPPPCCGGVEDPQGDIILDDYVPDCSGDSAMEDVEPESWEVVGIATTAQTGQPYPLVVSGNECVSFSGVLPWPKTETAAFVNTGWVPTFEPPMLGNITVAKSVVPQHLLLPQAAHLQASAPLFILDQPQPSTSMAEIEPLKPSGCGHLKSLPFPCSTCSSGPDCKLSSFSPSSPPPPRVVSNPASPSTYNTMGHRKRVLEDLEQEIHSCPASPAGIPRKMAAPRYV